MSAAFLQPAPVDLVADAARVLGRRGGRPRGSIGPLAIWLKPQIKRFKSQGANCTNVFRSLSLVEGGDGQSFSVSQETADAYYLELGVDLAGVTVTLVNFKKIWQRA